MSDTSDDANRSMEPFKSTLREAVFEQLATYPHGATDEVLQIALDMNPSTQRPRRGELVKLNRVHDTGERWATRSGRKAIVWATGPAPEPVA